MDLAHKANSVSVLSPRRFLPYFPQNWIALLFGLYRAWRLFLRRERHEGMYEILEYDSTLALVDPRGETAIFKRHQRVKFLQENVIAFQDCAWGDGEIFADYRCSPGVEVHRYQEGRSLGSLWPGQDGQSNVALAATPGTAKSTHPGKHGDDDGR